MNTGMRFNARTVAEQLLLRRVYRSPRFLAGMMLCSFASMVGAHPFGLGTLIPCLPQHKYVKIGDPTQFAVPGLPPIVLSNGIHHSFSDCFNFPTGLATEIHQFSSELTLGLQPFGRLTLPALTRISIRRADDPGTAAIEFETEMLQLDLIGATPIGPIVLREDPVRPSLGRSSIEEVSPGLFHIDSFFDVFVELSLDGGLSFVPGTAAGAPVPGNPQPIRVVLIPAPGALSLLILGLGVIGCVQRSTRCVGQTRARARTAQATATSPTSNIT